MNDTELQPGGHLLRLALISAPIVCAAAGALAYIRSEWDPSKGLFFGLVGLAAAVLGAAAVRIWMAETVMSRLVRPRDDLDQLVRTRLRRSELADSLWLRSRTYLPLLELNHLRTDEEAEHRAFPETWSEALFPKLKPNISGQWMIFALHRDENGRSIVFSDRDERPTTFPFGVRDPAQLVLSSGLWGKVYRFGSRDSEYTLIVFSERRLPRRDQVKLERAATSLARGIGGQDIQPRD